MTKRIFVTCAMPAVLAALAAAQTTTTTATATPALADQSPLENTRGGSVRTRNPGLTIQAALARHRELASNRLTAQGEADTSSLSTGGTSTTGGVSGTTGNSLTDLLSGVLGSGGLGNLSGLLGGLTGTGTTTGNSNIPSNITPEVIAMLQGAGININDVFPATGTSTSSQKSTTGDRAQSSTPDTPTTETPFRIRWANTMMTTIFTSLTVGIQLPDVVDAFKNFLRPIFFPDLIAP